MAWFARWRRIASLWDRSAISVFSRSALYKFDQFGCFCVLTLECSAQTCNLNSLSRSTSKLRIISAKDAPLTGPEGSNCHSHSEQPKPRKCLCSIHTSFRLMEGESYRPPF